MSELRSKVIKETLKKLISKTVDAVFGIKLGGFEIEIPKNKQFGDYSVSVALSLSKTLKKPPQEIAEEIVAKIEKSDLIEKTDTKAGFINFWLKEEWLQKRLNKILKEDNDYGASDLGKGKKAIVEFISANPTGPLTLGNGRGGFYGDVLSNVLEKAGYKVEREYYINDTGNQIETLGVSILKSKIKDKKLKTQIKDEKLYQGKYVEDLAKKLKGDDPIKLGEQAAKIILEKSIKKDIRDFKIKFDRFVSEKEIVKGSGTEKVINQLKKKKLIYEKDEALWFNSKKFGDDQDRVLIKADGQPTYFATDIAYHLDKLNRCDKAVNFWGADHFGYVRRLKGAMAAFGLDKKLKIIVMQLVRLIENGKEVKMSKRAGTYVTLKELVDEVKLDAARYFFISIAPETHMDFDLKLAKERSVKNPVYYVQYAGARIHGILAKLKTQSAKLKTITKNLKLLKEPAEADLIKQLIKFPGLIEEIAQNYQVHKLPHYVYGLATAFHNFYEQCQVITEDKNQTEARLSLVLATEMVLKNTLSLMGISAPEKM